MSNMGGGLSDIASSMGFNINGSTMSDAITPEFYPKLMKSNNYIVRLIDCPVKTADGAVNTNYYTYLQKYQKSSPLDIPIAAVKKLFAKKPQSAGKNHKLNPFKLTKEEDEIFNAIRSKISCSVDKRTNLITITVEDQDPLIAATMTNQASEQLKDFISNYRTSKTRKDLAYYQNLADKAKREYEKARQLYGSYSDAKVLEKTPVFTTVSAASVPLLPAGPKRMLFVAAMLFIAFLVSTIFFTRDLIF